MYDGHAPTMDSSTTIILLILGGALSGFINTLASSGSAITLPLLVLMGVSAPVANGTNRIPLLAGALAAVIVFQRKKAIDWRGGVILTVPIVLGTAAGAGLASVIDAKAMGRAIIAAVVMALILLMTNAKRMLNMPASGKLYYGWRNHVVFFFVGVWAGFVVLDSATYLLMGLVFSVGYDLIRANAIKSLLLLVISICSLAVFTHKHEVDWTMGAFLAVGSIGGAWAGSLLATKEWAKVWVFRLLVVVILLEIVNLLLKYGIFKFLPGG